MSINASGEITSEASRGRPDGGFLGLLRAVALVAVVVGAAGSVALTLRVGRHNPSRLLLVLFTTWVLSPLVALVLANKASNRWSVLTRAPWPDARSHPGLIGPLLRLRCDRRHRRPDHTGQLIQSPNGASKQSPGLDRSRPTLGNTTQKKPLPI
jgi:hypothetical protein